MSEKLYQGSTIPDFKYDTPYHPQQSFYQLLEGEKPVILLFLRNFGHPLSRYYIQEYCTTAEQLTQARLVCVVRSSPKLIADAMPEGHIPFQVICDPEGALYSQFGVESEPHWMKSYSFKALRIMKNAKKQGFEENRKEPQQLPLTVVATAKGKVMYAHYGCSLTDLPENCAAMQRVMERLNELLKSAEPEDDTEGLLAPQPDTALTAQRKEPSIETKEVSKAEPKADNQPEKPAEPEQTKEKQNMEDFRQKVNAVLAEAKPEPGTVRKPEPETAKPEKSDLNRAQTTIELKSSGKAVDLAALGFTDN